MKVLQINKFKNIKGPVLSNSLGSFSELARVILFLGLSCLSYIIPKSKKKIIFLCNEAGSFSGNIKPLIQYAITQRSNKKIMIFTTDKATFNVLLKSGYNVFLYPTFMAIWHLSTTEKIIIENGMTLEKCGICFNSKVFQLWHGANLKYMVKQWDELRDRSNESFLGKSLRNWKVQYPKYEFILAPSEFYKTNTFEKSFNSKNVFVAGYPRNDIFFRPDSELDFEGASKELISKAIAHRSKGGRVVLYCPTWRDQVCETEEVSPFTHELLVAFLAENNILLIVKKHHRDKRQIAKTDHPLIDIYHHSLDIYPLMKHTDILISDYSSIFFDYLLLNKPVVFFPYDYKIYMTRDRLFQYDYNEFTPGCKCESESELYSEIVKAMSSLDYYLEDRQRVKKIVFDENKCENSSHHIWNEIIKS